MGLVYGDSGSVLVEAGEVTGVMELDEMGMVPVKNREIMEIVKSEIARRRAR